jgi:hypothetical protein
MLDDRLVADSNYVTKMRGIIASVLFHKGQLTQKQIKRMGYDIMPPDDPSETTSEQKMSKIST